MDKTILTVNLAALESRDCEREIKGLGGLASDEPLDLRLQQRGRGSRWDQVDAEALDPGLAHGRASVLGREPRSRRPIATRLRGNADQNLSVAAA